MSWVGDWGAAKCEGRRALDESGWAGERVSVARKHGAGDRELSLELAGTRPRMCVSLGMYVWSDCGTCWRPSYDGYFGDTH